MESGIGQGQGQGQGQEQQQQQQQQQQQSLLSAHTQVQGQGIDPNEQSRQQIGQMQQMWGSLERLSQSNQELRAAIAGMMENKMTPQNSEEDAMSPMELELKNLREAMGYLTEYLTQDRDSRYTQQNELAQQLKQQQDLAQEQQARQFVESSVAQLDGQLEEAGYPFFAQYRGLVRSAIENDPAWYQAQSKEAFEALLMEASNPETWARVYVEAVVPRLAQFGPELRKRSMNRAGHPEYDQYASSTDHSRVSGSF